MTMCSNIVQSFISVIDPITLFMNSFTRNVNILYLYTVTSDLYVVKVILWTFLPMHTHLANPTCKFNVQDHKQKYLRMVGTCKSMLSLCDKVQLFHHFIHELSSLVCYNNFRSSKPTYCLERQ